VSFAYSHLASGYEYTINLLAQWKLSWQFSSGLLLIFLTKAGLCRWVPFEDARPLIKGLMLFYQILKTLKYQASSPQLPSTSIGMSDAPNKDDSGKAFSDEDEEIDFALEGSYS